MKVGNNYVLDPIFSKSGSLLPIDICQHIDQADSDGLRQTPGNLASTCSFCGYFGTREQFTRVSHHSFWHLSE